MTTTEPGAAQQIARAAFEFERQRTGHAPQSVAVMLGEGTLVITLHGALSPAERALARSPDGASRVQELHRRIFEVAAGPLRSEIQRITGVAVREAVAEVEPASGTVVQVFTTGSSVQVFLLSGDVTADSWAGTDPGHPA